MTFDMALHQSIYKAQRIPGDKLVILEDSGHGLAEETSKAINAILSFLRE